MAYIVRNPGYSGKGQPSFLSSLCIMLKQNQLSPVVDGSYSSVQKDTALGRVALSILIVLILADLGLIGDFDAVIGAVALSLIFPSHSIFILLEIAAIQDAPGLSGLWWYWGMLAVGSIVITRFFLAGRIKKSVGWNKYLAINIAAFVVVLYGMVLSIMQALSGSVDPEGRSPVLVGALMLYMVFLAMVSHLSLRNFPQASAYLRITVGILVAHGLIVALMQTFGSPTFLASDEGGKELLNTPQLFEPAVYGFPRITGTYLTPNGFVLCYVLLVLLLLFKHSEISVSKRYALFFVSIGGLLSFLAFSKAMLLFVFLVSIPLIFQAYGLKMMLFGASFLIILFSNLFYFSGGYGTLIEAFRVPENGIEDMGYRGEVWTLLWNDFNFRDWLIGVGVGYWPGYFESKLGYSLSDPHSYVFSIPGNFGLVGVIFFVGLNVLLFTRLLSCRGSMKVLVCIMLILFLVKDLVSISYLFGNTPITFLIWLLLGQIFYPVNYSNYSNYFVKK